MTRDKNNNGSEHYNSEEWFYLSLGGTLLSTEGDLDPQSRPATSKAFLCNFCLRKFFNSHALGGHQISHKKERGAARRSKSQKMMTMMCLSMNAPILRSLDIQPHSLVHKPCRARITAAASGFQDGFAGKRMAFTRFMPEDQTDLVWPGNYRLDAQPEPSHKSLDLDLDLRL